jgi:hypothetical protein
MYRVYIDCENKEAAESISDAIDLFLVTKKEDEKDPDFAEEFEIVIEKLEAE